eukprot:6419656-Amphidinium_carterae.1
MLLAQFVSVAGMVLPIHSLVQLLTAAAISKSAAAFRGSSGLHHLFLAHMAPRMLVLSSSRAGLRPRDVCSILDVGSS